MHKKFYASGFLYHPPTQQILLQQQIGIDSSSSWSLIGGENKNKETAEISFKRILDFLLDLHVTLSAIYPIYAYFDQHNATSHSISYAEVKKMKQFPSVKGMTFSWFNRRQIYKIGLDEQTRQDVTIGLRVIDAKVRKSLGLRTLE